MAAIAFIFICSFWYIEKNVQLEKYKSSFIQKTESVKANKSALLKIEREFTEKLFLLAVSVLLLKIVLMWLIAYRQSIKVCRKNG